MAAASVSSFDGLAGQELASRLDRMMEKLHLQLCEKIRHEYLIRRDGKILWSGDGVSPHSEEEENHVSSENKEGRLDDDSGSNDVRLNFLPDGGGIEEPEHKTAETLISHGTYGIESFVQSFIVQWLREHVNLDNRETTFQNFDPDDESGSNDVRLNFPLDGGGIEEPEHKTAETLISQGTDGLERSLPFRIACLPPLSASPSSDLSTDGVSTGKEEEDNYVSATIEIGRLDDDSGNNDGGGIEEPEHKTAETLISQGTDGLERLLHYRIPQCRPLCPRLCPPSPSSDLSTDGVSTGNEEEDNYVSGTIEIGRPLCPHSPSSDLSADGVSTGNEEEDNYVSATIEIGRLDDDSGNNDVRLNFLPDGGGIEEPEHKTAETVGSHGTDGLQSYLQSVIVSFLRQEDVNLDNREKILDHFKFEDILRIDPSHIALLKQIINNVSTELSQMLKANPELSSEYYRPICWNSINRLEFFRRLNERLAPNPEAPNQQDELKELLLEELESKKSLVFDGEWIEKLEPKFWPCRRYDFKSVRELLRFVRNQWCHLPGEFEEFLGSDSAGRFYHYFHVRFPYLLMVSYRAAFQVCREEKWFEEYR
ncbi:hypothetical protein ACJRO7_005358 [Eucalyptus globulus]|uniref:KEN domain-containing protein n=1 Tax=Eucalyptus globulus TaxID=34317 RepID=A0ABD3J345_EUCGL